ncbi:MAG TPA: hypothetical protein PLI93_11815 [Gemmatimonadales bacterium]|nr:hypothetical protein [Gemmatimonadota bacterium]MCB9505907.1 hypothetical protein [Gemmatimonadales bacterium]MCB9519074.1 hypothetical protein [Gemmatimonadales bacterium]HPF62731.1 hypothetical protein [Gemmatimonadales bacterium]HRX18510.1 hypothetical protein [Gemmatimonadales bacterium]
MSDDIVEPGGDRFEPDQPGAVLATTDQPVPLDVHEIEDDRVPDGMRCLGTFLDGTLVARCAVPPGAAEFFARHGVFAEPRQLVLAAREEDPGLRCELYAIIPMPTPTAEDLAEEDDEDREPWAQSVPSSNYEQAVADLEEEAADEPPDGDGGPTMAAVLLGQIVRFQKDRRHPESLPLETVDVLARIVSGRVVEVVDKVLGDLLGP